jgi:hypothetical protein
VDSVDGLRPPSLPTGPSTAEGRSIFIILDTIVPVSPGTNVCPEKSGAAHREFVAGYNAEWLVEKNGFRSPLHARAAHLDTNLRRAA